MCHIAIWRGAPPPRPPFRPPVALIRGSRMCIGSSPATAGAPSVVVSVRRIVVAGAVDELVGGVASLPGGLVVANRRTVMSGPYAARGRLHRPRGLSRRGTW